ncbi:unnamed protein product [Closterium sp. NIES-65]|nr:unnamed protein product [Closterium sp. NIES-65]
MFRSVRGSFSSRQAFISAREPFSIHWHVAGGGLRAWPRDQREPAGEEDEAVRSIDQVLGPSAAGGALTFFFLPLPPFPFPVQVHITGVGDFQLAQIDQVPDPCAAGEHGRPGGRGGGSKGKEKKKGGTAKEGMEEEEGEEGEEGEVEEEGEEEEEGGVRVLARSSAELRDPLVVLNTLDPLAGEQAAWMQGGDEEESEGEEEDGEEGQDGEEGEEAMEEGEERDGGEQGGAEEEEEGSGSDWEEVDEDDGVGGERLEGGSTHDGLMVRAALIPCPDDNNPSPFPSHPPPWMKRSRGREAALETHPSKPLTEIHEDIASTIVTHPSPRVCVWQEEDDAEGEAEKRARAQWEEMKRLRTQQQEDQGGCGVGHGNAEVQEFPDEVDTPDDIPARQRFAKYRGLKSFRSSPWDPKESLPPEYARIFSFDNWKRTQKAAEERAAAVDRGEVPGSVGAGTFVRLHIMNVPCFEAERLQHEVTKRGLPLVVTGLLQHETRMTVLHFSVKKSDSFAPPIKSKQRLLFHCGFRRFYSRPTFSTDDINLDKHKFERFLHPGRFAVASIFAPTLFPPLPLLVFADPSAANQHTGEGVGGGSVGGSVVGGSVVGEGEELQLAATGALRGPDPDRIILKKIVLSGYPVSVMKRKAVVRYMFHQPEDGRWFQPVELFTKYGRRGRIREPVGTKGAIKCVFDGVVQQRDAVCMALYKRVYPKFPVLPASL